LIESSELGTDKWEVRGNIKLLKKAILDYEEQKKNLLDFKKNTLPRAYGGSKTKDSIAGLIEQNIQRWESDILNKQSTLSDVLLKHEITPREDDINFYESFFSAINKKISSYRRDFK
jgi:hypothetical protein